LTPATYLPPIDLLLQALRTTRDRLDGRARVAVDPRLPVHLLRRIAAAMPFDESFYLTAYGDVAEAHGRGDIGDLHQHYIEAGLFEGRMGADPGVDADYYLAANPDVGRAISAGQIASAAEHYLRRGAAEGRAPNVQLAAEAARWIAALRPED